MEHYLWIFFWSMIFFVNSTIAIKLFDKKIWTALFNFAFASMALAWIISHIVALVN